MSYNLDALRNINFNYLTTLPIGTFVFATSDTSFDSEKKREIFPADTWIDASEGLIYQRSQWLELAEAKPDWVKGDQIVIPNYIGRFPRAYSESHPIDKIENFSERSIEGELSFIRRENPIPGQLNIYLNQLQILENSEYIKVDDKNKLTPSSNEIRPNCISLNFFVYASSKRARQEALKLLELSYPIGSVYTSIVDPNNTNALYKNPKEILGFGEWVMLTEAGGKSLVMIDPKDSDFITTEKTGGKRYIKLEKENIPSHSHKFMGYKKQFGSTRTNNNLTTGTGTNDTMNSPLSIKSDDYGEGKEFDNQHPYFTVVYWVRRG